MKNSTLLLMIGIIAGLISCQKDSFENQSHSGKIKKRTSFFSIDDTIPRSIDNYSYDQKGRLSKIQNQSNSQLFEYNPNDELIRKYTYQTDVDKTTLIDTTWYKYQNGNLIFEEKVQLPVSEYTSTIQYKYAYENSKLIRKKDYRNKDIFTKMTTYQYSGDLLSKEIYYNDSIGNSVNSFRSYIYDNNLLTMSILYGFDARKDQYVLQSVYYFYDDFGTLIWDYAESSEFISAWLGFYNKYEYY